MENILRICFGQHKIFNIYLKDGFLLWLEKITFLKNIYKIKTVRKKVNTKW